MKLHWLKYLTQTGINPLRRKIVQGLVAGSGLVLLNSETKAADAGNSEPQSGGGEMRFPGDPADHKVVYQFNKGSEEYQTAVLFSVGAMLRKYTDNVQIVVVGIGPGIHILAKKPKRPVSDEIKQRVSSLAQYGVEFHACGNTMKSLKWDEKDILPFAKIVDVGAADIMELQEQGYSYLSW